MDFLSNISMRLIGTICTVGVLAAVYFFAIKPTLDTTNKAFNQFAPGFNQAMNQVNQAVQNTGVNPRFQAKLQRQIRQAQQQGLSTARKANKLTSCLHKAAPDNTRMQACVKRFTP